MSGKPHYHIAIIVLWRDGKILTTKRLSDAEHLANLWEFPGGKCAPDESPPNAARREALEELGVEVEITSAYPLLEFDYETRLVTLHPFDACLLSGEPQALQSAAMRWLLPAELRDEEFPPANGPLLEELRMRCQ